MWLPLKCPLLGPGLQPRHVPWARIEPATFWFTGQRSIHWATPARAGFVFFLIFTRGHFSMLLERGEKRENRWCKREELIGCLSCMPGPGIVCTDWWLNPQPRYVPWLEMEPANFQLGDNAAPTNWAELARAEGKGVSTKEEYSGGDGHGGICACRSCRLVSQILSVFRGSESQLTSQTISYSQGEFWRWEQYPPHACLQSGIAYVVKEIFTAKWSSISREPLFVFFVRLKPQVREGNVVGIISHSGWYKSKEKNNSSTLKQLI